MAIRKTMERMQQTLVNAGRRVSMVVGMAPGKTKLKETQQKPGEVDERVAGKAEAAATGKSKHQKTRSKVPRKQLRVAPAPAAKKMDVRMDIGSCYVPLYGEDAHFVQPGAGVIGVADGVGSYRRMGVDAGAFARALMRKAGRRAATSPRAAAACPLALLRRAYRATLRSRALGASTAAVVSVDRGATATLRWACVGDSGLAVLRGGRVVRRSARRQHRFGCPFRLGAQAHGDSLDDSAEVGDMAARHGDVVVLATDGLFDNMGDAQLECAVRMGTELGVSPKEMADAIAGYAYKVSNDKAARPPYSVEYREARGVRRYGGKKDDITVVVAYIVSKDS